MDTKSGEVNTFGEISPGAVIDAFRPLIPLCGEYADPSELPEGNAGVQAAFKLYYDWLEQEKARFDVQHDPEGNLEYELRVVPFFIEAGFCDPDYIDEVINDWLAQHLEAAEEQGFDDLAARIQAKMNSLTELLTSIEGSEVPDSEDDPEG